MQRIPSSTALVLLFPPWASAQGAPFQTPGTPSYPEPSGQSGQDSGQADRFTSGFNPAFSFIVDTVGDYLHFDEDSDESGFDASLRVLEVASQAWVDPNAWAYFVGAAEEEELTIEEAAIHYVGLGPQTTLRGGRFFIDFGKQMQIHVHELRTLERPLVLRAYLGEEVKGDGLQYDQWAALGDRAAIRWSVGVFANLLPEEAEFRAAEVEQSIEERKDFGDFNFTGRVTAFRDVGESGTLQVGASARAIPDYSVEDAVNGLSEEELHNEVYGVDLTYGWADDTGEKRLTLGAEALLNAGDDGFSLTDPDGTPATGDESLQILDDSVFGYFGFADYAWSRYQSAGLQYSAAEIPDGLGSDVTEIELYYTRRFSEFHRLRFVGSWAQDDTVDDDALRFAVQYTAVIGAHGHGVNW